MTQNYAKLLRLLRSDSEVVRAHAAFTGADIIESLQAQVAELEGFVKHDYMSMKNWQETKAALEEKIDDLTNARDVAWDKGYSEGRLSWHQTIAALQDRVEELETGIRDHIDWADTAVDCDELKILIGDMQEDE